MTRQVFVMRMRKDGASSWGRRKSECRGEIRLFDQYDRLLKVWRYANIYYFGYRMRQVEKTYKAISGYYVVVSPVFAKPTEPLEQLVETLKLMENKPEVSTLLKKIF